MILNLLTYFLILMFNFLCIYLSNRHILRPAYLYCITCPNLEAVLVFATIVVETLQIANEQVWPILLPSVIFRVPICVYTSKFSKLNSVQSEPKHFLLGRLCFVIFFFVTSFLND